MHTISDQRLKASTVEELFTNVKSFLAETEIEGVVWHHAQGHMAKIKRRDFSLPWPIKLLEEQYVQTANG